MPEKRHIFFDLDHTLWDFEANSRSVLQELLPEFSHNLSKEIDFPSFFEAFNAVLKVLWRQHREGSIGKEGIRKHRFPMVFAKFDVSEGEWMKEMESEYLARTPIRGQLVEGAIEILDHLNGKFPLHIITNSFTKPANLKISSSGILPYFDQIITSEMAGVTKPNPKIFELALKMSNALPENSIIIGDSIETDIKGGIQAGLQTIYYRRAGQPEISADISPTIEHLEEIKSILP